MPPAGYPINKVHKAHYVLMNVECSQPCWRDQARSASMMRCCNLIISRPGPDTEASPLAKSREGCWSRHDDVAAEVDASDDE